MGSVITWGDRCCGGDMSEVKEQLCKDVFFVYSTSTAFAAVKDSGTVVCWGDARGGGRTSHMEDKFELMSPVAEDELDSNVQHICSTSSAFAAVTNDGSVVTWGAFNSGGNSSVVASQLSLTPRSYPMRR